MQIDYELHRKALGAATCLLAALRVRGLRAADGDLASVSYDASRVREEWARLKEAMPGVLAELPEVPEDAP